jgi:hypothetical protein
MTRATHSIASQRITHVTFHTPTRHTQAPHSHNNCALHKHHCTRPPHAHHTAPSCVHPTPFTQLNTPINPRSIRVHTHRSPIRLPSVDGTLPDSWLSFSLNSLQDTQAAIASHHGTRRRCRTQPAARNKSQRIALHRSYPMNSSQLTTSTC